MKVKGLIITGIVLAVVGISLTAVASTQININEEWNTMFVDPSLEEKKETFGDIVKIVYEGSDASVDIVYQEEENSFTYYEGKNITYDITYDEALQELHIKQQHSFSFFNFSFGGRKATLSIHSSLEELSICVSAGNIGIKHMEINTGTFDIDAGNLKIEDTTFTSLDAELSAGNLNMNQSKATKAILELSAGNLKMEQTIVDYIKARISAGNLTFKGDALSFAEFKLDAGNLKLNLDRESTAYQVNGRGEGASLILYEVSAGNKTIAFKE